LTATTDNPHRKAAALADPKPRELLRKADPGLAVIEKALTEVPGIGPWTALGFLIFGVDRPDVLLSGALAVRRAIERATDPTTFQPKTRRSRSRSDGGRIEALP
jgi:3-methyladenine DNA glycosylase/8-oxoguanine DNA glycosylase